MTSSISVQVPKLTMAATDAVFLGWLVDDGATVEAQQPIYTVATDKVEVEVEVETKPAPEAEAETEVPSPVMTMVCGKEAGRCPSNSRCACSSSSTPAW